MKNFVQSDETVLATAPYDVAAGDGVLVGSLFGVAVNAAKAGERVTLKTRHVYDLTKVPAQVWTQWVAVYWDNTARNVTTTVGTNTKIGVAALAAVNPSTVGRVRLNGAF